ncbi:hypothetical protein CTEN210_17247 [Chaetoceros tenuissimus]|uniref:ABC transporter domain-containing protein n=1 Tax=Chaetoceros tenuissimus TaxID=426638 RepID=A0AAD3DCI6_9STRA|nr:hypothetical protein CTEN210_17247 [Chaetoceros tenuissimus]
MVSFNDTFLSRLILLGIWISKSSYVAANIPPPPPPGVPQFGNGQTHQRPRPPSIHDNPMKKTAGDVNAKPPPPPPNQVVKEKVEEKEEYSEQIMSRKEAEDFIKNFDMEKSKSSRHKISSRPPPPITQEKDESDSKQSLKSFIENIERKNIHGNAQNEMGKIATPPPPINQQLDVNDVIENDSFEMSNKEVDSNRLDGKEDQEWIVPKDMQFRAEPEKTRETLQGSEEETLAPLVENRQPTGYPRTYPQRPLPHQRPPNSIAPRNYDYHQRNQQSQQNLHRPNQMQPPPPQQMQQQRYPNSQDGFSQQDRNMLQPQSQGYRPMPPHQYPNQNIGPGALIPHRPQTPQRRGMGFGQSIFQKVGQSLDALSDVDGMIAQRAQSVLKTVSSSSDSIAGGVSNVMRKTVFTSLDSVTGIKENIKDQVRGRMSNIFGGAPTSASEARDQWEDDRRRTVTENRRRAILGTSRSSGDEHEGESSFEDSPLHQVLYGTAPEIQTDEHGQDVNCEEGQQDIQDWDHSDPQKVSLEECSDETQVNDDNQIEENPFAVLAYPTSSNLDEDDSSDIEDVDDDLVDPTTIFIQSETRSPRAQTPATFDFEDEPLSIMQKFGGLFQLPKLPSFGKRIKSDFDLSGWDDDDDWEVNPQKKVVQTRREIRRSTTGSSSSGNSVNELLERYETSSSVAKKATTSLVTNADIRQLRRLGKSKAVFDLMAVGFLYLTVTEMFRLYGTSFNMQQWRMPQSMDDFSMTLRQISSTFGISDSSFFGSWAPYAIVSFFLANCNGHIFIQPKIQEISQALSIRVESIVLYSQLFLRSITGIPCDQSLQKISADAAAKQCATIVEIARLRTFVSVAVMVIFLGSVAVVKPIFIGIVTAVLQFATMSELREMPFEWGIIGEKSKKIISQLGSVTLSLLHEEVGVLQSNPMSIVSSASVMFALVFLSQMPVFERVRKIGTTKADNFVNKNVGDLLQIVSNLGGSSASRLGLQIQGDSVKKMISQIQSMLVSTKKKDPSLETANTILFFRLLAYTIVSTIICGAPVAVHALVTSMNGQGVGTETIGVAIVMMWTMKLLQNAVKNAICSSNISSSAQLGSFLYDVANTMREIETTSRQGNPNSSPSSLTKGIEISDLWAAHSGKRAWACRGINFNCKAGEVVVVLGEECSGKTKLLTTIAEVVVSPPQIGKTTNIARGKVSIGGVDVQNWNQTQLRGKVGIFLNDAKTLDCMSELHSGQMLKDILRPGTPSSTSNSAVESALQIANQFIGMTNMIAKLPEKLETRITCNEEDLSLDPKLTLLSSSEWSKVLLTKLFAQIVMSNDNPMASPSTLSKSLVGSILLLDDVTTHLDEITEAKLLKSLKNSGVATIITSKRWSVGRYASRIIVMKDGSIIESGTHSELMAKGADNSIYAAQWSKIMSN